MRESWEGAGRGTSRIVVHESGWSVRHCGHGTALFPWYVESPEGVAYTSPSGHAWAHQGDACRVAEDLATGGTGPAWPISQASLVRAEQKAAPYGGAARRRMSKAKALLQGEIMDRTDAERWRWVRMTHAETLAELVRGKETA